MMGYYVYCPSTGYTKFKHEELDNAMQEAERLARLNRNQEFVILKEVSKCKVSDIVWEDLSEDGIPF